MKSRHDLIKKLWQKQEKKEDAPIFSDKQFLLFLAIDILLLIIAGVIWWLKI